MALENKQLLEEVTSYFLKSTEFNGLPIHSLIRRFPNQEVYADLSELIEKEKITVVFGDRHPNPHINALPNHLTPQDQIGMLQDPEWASACAYPTKTHLSTVPMPEEYKAQPYTLMIASGDPALTYRSFDLAVLETYRNDPRYIFETNDINGHLSVTDQIYKNGQIAEQRTAFLQTFGFSFDDEKNRYVAVFLRYLSQLTPQQQHFWKTYEIEIPTKLHPDYFRTSILGDFPQGISMFRAFFYELEAINELAITTVGQKLFRKDFSGERTPKEFAFLLRPTAREFNHFVHLLDKLVSDNLNRNFFRGIIPLQYEEERDGKVYVQNLGTIQLLGNWLQKEFPAYRSEEIEIRQILKSIRGQRQKPAHEIENNQFDQKFIHLQRQLIDDALFAMNLLRRVMQSHPATAEVKLKHDPEAFKVWAY